MIITKENKYMYYYHINKWIKSCKTEEQLDNVYEFVFKILKQNRLYKGTFEFLGYYSYFKAIITLIKKQNKIIDIVNNSNNI